MATVRFVRRTLPDFETPAAIPILDPLIFQQRYERLERAREAAGLECLAIYADREHSANLAWLTGFDPEMMKRCRTRRALMEDLGYELGPDILPLGNIAGVFFPFMLDAAYVGVFR